MLGVCFLLMIGEGRAQSPRFYEGNAFEALSVAQRDGKLLVVEFYADWNRKSRWMHSAIEKCDGFDSKFIFVSTDTQTTDGAALASQYGVSDYPFLVIFDAKGDAIESITKTLSREDFSAKLGEILLATDPGSMWQLQTILRSAKNPTLSDEDKARLLELTSNYLKTQDKMHLTALSHWEIFLSDMLTYYGSDCYEYLINNYRDFYDKDEAHGRIQEIVYSVVINSIIEDKTDNVAEIIATDSTIKRIIPEVNYLLELREIKQNGDIDGYISQMERTINKIPSKYEYQLIMTIGDFINKGAITDRKNKAACRKMLEDLQQKNNSSAKLSLIESLLDKL